MAPLSILDQDLYKFCMQQAVLEHYPDADAEYGLVTYHPAMRFSSAAFERLQRGIAGLARVRATAEELEYLGSACPRLSAAYIAFLAGYRFNPAAEVACSLDEPSGALRLTIAGKWLQTILYEVPVLALVTEAYFGAVDTDWSHCGQHERAAAKARRLVAAGCRFAELGTRRRRDFETQDAVVAALARVSAPPRELGPGRFVGTSNAYLARKHGVPLVGAIGHEWIMGVAALEGTYAGAALAALQKWLATFGGGPEAPPTDTFGTEPFLAALGADLAAQLCGLAHDSGDPHAFVEAVSARLRRLGVDPSTKTAVFTDGITPDAAAGIKAHCDRHSLGCVFGMGTHLTNDFPRASDPAQPSIPPSLSVKLRRCGGRPCIKLGDDPAKSTGCPAELARARLELLGGRAGPARIATAQSPPALGM
ncbi:nicotinate phosphoribosyltransferase [Coemansia javaensis]|uniref:Nicotinate phosphoribosyltransferase n=1 Tax=Coemansia javaensis TaxID=2761396 RepID=A0A9W8HAB6_9FUNG|nr:nicotinate phosphoribosyltransferase [Coemansia javaensis]